VADRQALGIITSANSAHVLRVVPRMLLRACSVPGFLVCAS
jgi:hypothetical protein